MGELPEGWDETPLSSIASVEGSRVLPKSHPRLPYIGMEHVESHTRKLLATALSSSMKSTCFHFKPGQVLYGRLRPYLNKVYPAKIEGLCSSEFIVLSPQEMLDFSYLAYYLSTFTFVEFANHLNTGDRPRVSFKQIADYPIPLAPLSEQRRIVQQLDHLMPKLEASRARLDAVPNTIKRFRQAILSAACSGRLTEDWRRAHPSSQDASSSDAIAHAIDTIEFEELPDSWAYSPIGAVLHSLKYGTSHKCSYDKKGVPVLRIPNISSGIIDVSDMKYAPLPGKEYEALRLHAGDILLIRSNGSVSLVGKSALVRNSEEGFAYAGYLIRLRLNPEKAVPEYINTTLAEARTRQQIEIPARSTSGVNNINSDEVKALVIPLPPIEEQREIVRRVEALFRQADAIQARYEKARVMVDRLPQAILAKAFRGELLSQP